jgi:inner membrane protein
VVAVGGGAHHEGFYSFFDDGPHIDFRRVDCGDALWPEVQHIDGMQRIARFSEGFYALKDDEGLVRISDLRMGQHPSFTFAFHAAQRQAGGAAVALTPPRAVGQRPDAGAGLQWLRRRMWGQRLLSLQ